MTKFSAHLQEKVQNHCDFFKVSTPLFKCKVNHYHAAFYVKNLEHLFKSNAEDMFVAYEKYASKKSLSEYFFQKWSEEKGHDAWAREDWVKMSKRGDMTEASHVLPEMLQLTDFLHQTMLSSPYRYITYMYVAEYMTPILGPIWMELLEKNLGIKNHEITALTNHIELDGAHSEEVGRVLDSFDLDTEVRKDLMAFVGELFVKYDNFFSALSEVGEIYGRRESQKPLKEILA